jgi:hypothetical protein
MLCDLTMSLALRLSSAVSIFNLAAETACSAFLTACSALVILAD